MQSYQQILARQETFTRKTDFDEAHKVEDKECTVLLNRNGTAVFKKIIRSKVIRKHL